MKTPRLSELDDIEMREQEDSKEIEIDKASAQMSDKKSNQEDALSSYDAHFSDLEDVVMT